MTESNEESVFVKIGKFLEEEANREKLTFAQESQLRSIHSLLSAERSQLDYKMKFDPEMAEFRSMMHQIYLNEYLRAAQGYFDTIQKLTNEHDHCRRDELESELKKHVEKMKYNESPLQEDNDNV